MNRTVRKTLAIIQFCLGFLMLIASFEVPMFLGNVWCNPIVGILGIGIGVSGLEVLDNMTDSPSNK